MIEKIDSLNLKDEKISIVIAIHLTLIIGKNILVSTSGPLLAYNGILNGMILLFVLVAYFKLVNDCDFIIKMDRRTVVIVALIVCFILLSVLFDNELFFNNTFPYLYVRKQARLFLAYGLPLFLGISSLTTLEYLMKYLYKTRYLLFGCAVVSFGFSLVFNSTVNEYSMSYGNNVLFVCIILLFSALRNNKLVDFILFCFCALFILIAGSRGPLVSIMVALIVAIILKKWNKNNIVVLMIIFMSSMFIIVYFQDFVKIAETAFKEVGINSRTIAMLTTGKISFDSGRSEYHEALISTINQHPLIGLGAFGGEKTVGLAHSFYLDVFANFGYLFGALFLCLILIKSIEIIKSGIDYSTKDMLMIQLVILLPRGFFDETFWGNKEIWILLGIFIVFDKYKENISNITWNSSV